MKAEIKLNNKCHICDLNVILCNMYIPLKNITWAEGAAQRTSWYRSLNKISCCTGKSGFWAGVATLAPFPSHILDKKFRPRPENCVNLFWFLGEQHGQHMSQLCGSTVTNSQSLQATPHHYTTAYSQHNWQLTLSSPSRFGE